MGKELRLRKKRLRKLAAADQHGIFQNFQGAVLQENSRQKYLADKAKGVQDRSTDGLYGLAPEHKASKPNVNGPSSPHLSTRYVPGKVGIQARRVGDGVVQDPITGKVYDYSEGFKTEDGHEFPAGDVSLQTGLVHLANRLDSLGLVKEASILDDVLYKLAEEDSVVIDTIKRSLEMPHFKNTFLTRNPGPESEGSTFLEPQTPESLMSANWEKYDHPDIAPPAIGYKADIPGKVGVIKLSELNPETPIKMELGHKGEDEFVFPIISQSDVPSRLSEVDFTTLLIGPGGDDLIVYTFFPGDPIMPSTTTPSEETESAKTVRDAMRLGFEYGKVSGR